MMRRWTRRNNKKDSESAPDSEAEENNTFGK
jgi:hypothetical protein